MAIDAEDNMILEMESSSEVGRSMLESLVLLLTNPGCLCGGGHGCQIHRVALSVECSSGLR
jgi:hypothetical protein